MSDPVGLLVGQQLGNYRLIRLLGQGGFAHVYLAEHLHLGTRAAIKVLNTKLMSDELDAFRREARTIARLEHPHIVRLLDFDVQDNTPFLVMSYAPGGSLRSHHPKGSQLPLETIVSYVKQVADALQYAHDEQLIHRDIKPSNMLLGRQNSVLLTDFGLAIVMQSTSNQQIHEAAGTIAFMAPEQIQGHPCPASDQYALGVVVYEWLCGERPFRGTLAEIVSQHLYVPPPPLRKKVPAIPSVVEYVVLKSLAKDPDARFASARAFARALEEASKDESSERTIFVPSSEDSVPVGYLSAIPAGKSRTVPNHNLPEQLTPLLGRDKEVAAVCALLRRSEVRLVTLTGTGGIGKTRLGLKIATDLLHDFADGVCFVALAPISDPELVMTTVAQAFGLKETGDQFLFDLLKAYLREKHLLLLLDNFEQIVSAAPQLVELLTVCPHLKILVTSRAVLHIQGEHEFPVPPLAMPDLAHLPESEALSHYAAVALFLQRAQVIKPGFQMTKANARAVAEICTRLDGLPLAIELAASRIKLLPPQPLLTRLEHRLQLLTGGAQNLPRRQQTLRNTLQWSYDLLSAEEQRLFRRFSVFVGGCSLEAAESICAALDGEAGTVLDAVTSLIDKSLLQQTEQEDEEPRLTMLETIREYGLEALSRCGEMEVTRQAHAVYYLALAEEVEPELAGPQQTPSIFRLKWERENLRAALQWLLEQEEKEMALRLAAALRRFWSISGPAREGQRWLEKALLGSQNVQAQVRAKALYAAGDLALLLHDIGAGALWCEESLKLYQELGDKRGIAASLIKLGWASSERGNIMAGIALDQESLALFRVLEDRRGIAESLYDQGAMSFLRGELAMASEKVEESLKICRDLDDQNEIATALYALGCVTAEQGDFIRAHELQQESLALAREVGNRLIAANPLLELAWIPFLQGDAAAALPLLEETLPVARESDDKRIITLALSRLGEAILNQGDVARAQALLEESVALSKEAGILRGIASRLPNLAMLEAYKGDYTTAESLYKESLALASELGLKLVMTSGLEGIANIARARGEFVWAAQLWGAAESLRETTGAPLPPVYRTDYERSVAAIRAQLGEKAFATMWAEGRTMTAEQALAAKGQMMRTPTPTEPSSTSPAKHRASYPAGLTSREVEVLRLIAQGLTDAQIAEQLVITRRTVNWYLTSIYGKLGVSSRSAATRYAIKHNLD